MANTIVPKPLLTFSWHHMIVKWSCTTQDLDGPFLIATRVALLNLRNAFDTLG